VDDGASDAAESVAMARIAYEDGIRHIFATPHFTEGYYNHRTLVEKKVSELQATLDDLSINVRIYPSNEVRIESKSFVFNEAKDHQFCYLGTNQKFILLEQPWGGYEPDSLEVVSWFIDRGVTPIIPHPERHLFFRQQPELLDRLIEAGAWTQVTADSLIGHNHEDARQFATRLIERGLAHTLATDAHNIRRKPNLSQGFRAVEQIAGRKAADTIRDRMEQFIEG
jgi:protein-tyrosine phosphatase